MGSEYLEPADTHVRLPDVDVVRDEALWIARGGISFGGTGRASEVGQRRPSHALRHLVSRAGGKVDAQIFSEALTRIHGRKNTRQLAVPDHERGANMTRRHL